MIEIIREESRDGAEKKALPKDIKQIGRPDIGDRIYVEDEAYRFLHPVESESEKTAYVLLGRFENYTGKQCTFVEAAILLPEMDFDGEIPVWNDHTWAYIYRQLRHEYDSMVIVGWAMDNKGELPNLTGRIEKLHQNHFGGERQVLFLMDTLEQEEAFYGSRSGHLYRREGFYIYYDKSAAAERKTTVWQLEEEDGPGEPERERRAEGALYNGPAGIQEDASDWLKRHIAKAEERAAREDALHSERAGHPGRDRADTAGTGYPDDPETDSVMHTDDAGRAERDPAYMDDPVYAAAYGSGDNNTFPGGSARPERNGKEEDGQPGKEDGAGEEEISADDFSFSGHGTQETGNVNERKRERSGLWEPDSRERRRDGRTGEKAGRGVYRKQVLEREEKQTVSSYASSFLLLMVVCALGVTAYLNSRKMNEMEETIARMNQEKPKVTEQTAETDRIKIEKVAGNVQRQETERAAETASGSGSTGKAEEGNPAEQKAGKNEADPAAGEADPAAGEADSAAEAEIPVSTEAGNGTEKPSGGTGETGTQAGGGSAADQTASGGISQGEDGAQPDGDGQQKEPADSAGTDDKETAQAAAEAQTSLEQGYYIVQKGDSLVGICRKIYQTTAMLKKLCDANGIEDPDAIYAGQRLTLPHD